jgi:hypothetical protein
MGAGHRDVSRPRGRVHNGRMTSTSSRRLAALSLVAASALSSARVEAQATCIDSTGEACLNVVRAARPDGVVEDIFTTRDGLYAPQLTFATYIRGVNGCIGVTHTPDRKSARLNSSHNPASRMPSSA